MGKTIRYVGMDVHAATISVAVVEGRGQPRSLGTIENRPEAVHRLIGKLGEPKTLRVCFATSLPLLRSALKSSLQPSSSNVCEV
jgi:hypothetical protein